MPQVSLLNNKSENSFVPTQHHAIFFTKELFISAHTAAVTSFVLALPPRSLVVMPFSQTASTDFKSLAAASSSPSHVSISAAVQNVATGLAMPIPVMSNAEPWIGSNMLGFSRVGSRFEVGAMPMDPARAAARSDKISAC